MTALPAFVFAVMGEAFARAEGVDDVERVVLSDPEELAAKACEIRKHVIRMVGAASSGHPGGSLSAADIVTVLYFNKMRIRPDDPTWSGRDRFVLSKGHAAPVLYAALAEAGYFPVDDLITLRGIDSYLQGGIPT